MIKRFASYYKPHLKLFLADMICALILAVCDLVYPMITRTMLNDYIPNKTIDLLIMWAVILLILYLLKLMLNYFVAYYGHMVGVGLQSDMRREVFDHLERLPVTYFDNNKTGAIMSRIVTDLFDISELAHHGPEDLFLSVIMLIGSFVLMATIYLPLAVIVLAFLPLMVLFSAKKRIRMSKTSKQSRVEIGEVNATLENSISGIRVSKAYSAVDYENRHFEDGDKRFVAARKRQYKVMAEFMSGTTFIGDLLNVILYTAGGLFCYFGKIGVGDFAAFIIYVSTFMNPVRKLVGFVEQYQNGMTGFERFVEIMDVPVEEDCEGAVELSDVRGEIEFDKVSFSYIDSKEILHGLSLKIEPGKTLALVGPSGGGKTTICHLIPRFYSVNSGAIRVDGINVEDITLSSLRKMWELYLRMCSFSTHQFTIILHTPATMLPVKGWRMRQNAPIYTTIL